MVSTPLNVPLHLMFEIGQQRLPELPSPEGVTHQAEVYGTAPEVVVNHVRAFAGAGQQKVLAFSVEVFTCAAGQQADEPLPQSPEARKSVPADVGLATQEGQHVLPLTKVVAQHWPPPSHVYVVPLTRAGEALVQLPPLHDWQQRSVPLIVTACAFGQQTPSTIVLPVAAEPSQHWPATIFAAVQHIGPLGPVAVCWPAGQQVPLLEM